MPKWRRLRGQGEAARFWQKVDKTGDCWLWLGSLRSGYGRFLLDSGKLGTAHRWSYEQVNGPIADGLVIDHLCRNRACVNPAHLEAVTNQTNLLRSTLTGPGANAAKVTCHRGHPLSGENLAVDGRGKRRCKQCNREWQSERNAKRRAARLADGSGDQVPGRA